MSRVDTQIFTTVEGSVTDRFVELSDNLNAYLQTFRQFGIRSNRAVANFLCVDSAELSRLKNARVGDINLQRGYQILRKCEELARRLHQFGGSLKCKDVYSVGFNISVLPCVSKREQAHAIAVQQQSDAVLLTIDPQTQRSELDMLLGEALRSNLHPKWNPYGPMSIMYVLKSVYASPSATQDQLLTALRVAQGGRRACEKIKFNQSFDDETRVRTLAVILNNGGGIALRIAKESPTRRKRMLCLSRFLHRKSLEAYYFSGTVRGALTCANDLEDQAWAQDLLTLFVSREGADGVRWPKGINADINDPLEWSYLKQNNYWGLLNGHAKSNRACNLPIES